VAPALSVSPGAAVSRSLPAGRGWVASFDVLAAPGTRLVVDLGSGGDDLVIARAAGAARGRGGRVALYGFAVMGAELHDGSLLGVAERLAGYVARRVPASGVPPWDYSARSGAAVDVSAGVITAAGLLHLAAACSALRDVCSGDPSRWVTLARRMLAGALAHARATPPLGFLGSQVLNGRVRGCCRGGELIFGITYALEALKLSARAG
jgi:hypothetical protein